MGNKVKVGYACINTTLKCTANSTFRLKSYSESRLKETIEKNLNCLKEILEWNLKNKIFYFRIGSGLIPFASHPVNKFNWQRHYKNKFKKIGKYIKKNKMRVTMHPDQFTVLNSPNKEIVKKSIKELNYPCDILDAMELNGEHKIQIHVGGVYNEREKAISRFISTYNKLSTKIKKRLVLENDDRLYTAKECLEISKKTKIPIVIDNLHHECLNNGETLKQVISMASKTWSKKDGSPMLDYSQQDKIKRKGAHSLSISPKPFKEYLKTIKKSSDIMLEVKNKEKSVLILLKEGI